MNRNTETDLPEEIKDDVAKKWYDFGFRFAINYIHAILPESSNVELNQENFKAFLAKELVEGVNEKFFIEHPFNPGNYPGGQCPGDTPGTCIQCSDVGIRPLRS